MSRIRKNIKGFSLIELMIVMGIFSVVMAALYSVYSTQLREGIREYRLSESEMELQITKSIMERDIAMAGYGLAETYCEAPVSGASTTCPIGPGYICNDPGLGFCLPVGVSATDATTENEYDTLTLMGTAVGIESRASQEWSVVISDSSPTGTASYKQWDDMRETLANNDRIIYLEPNSKRFKYSDTSNDETGRKWLYTYPPLSATTSTIPTIPSEATSNDIVYGIQTQPTAIADHAAFPYNVVRYYVSDVSELPSTCAPGTKNLLRAEDRKNLVPTGGNPILNCVLDFQVAFGIDNDLNTLTKEVTCWDNGGAITNGWPNTELTKNLRQIRVYALVQEGARSSDFTYSNPADPSNPAQIRVGDLSLTTCGGGGIGRYQTLDDEQRKYRWRVLMLTVTPRNMK